jgi:hypothetical protein
MSAITLDTIYSRFADMYADSKAIRWQPELDAAIQAVGLDYPNVSRDWLASLDRAWVHRESDNPFRNSQYNVAYHRVLGS